ncbi:MAG TPA: pyridoxamine 5'-phosphate oxidase family protein [Pseudolysinimonas sp.]|jgi:PPOX class probable F420-dependent enzyme
MSIELPEKVRQFLEQPNPAVMATTTKDGRPVTVATWYLLEPDGGILVNLDAQRVRLAHLRRDPRFALDVLDGGNWGTHVALQLDVTGFTDDIELNDIDALATHYSGQRYPNRERPRVSVRGEILSWFGWGSLLGRG